MNAENIAAKHEIDLAYEGIEGSGDPGTGTGTGTGTNSNIWGSSGFWSAVNNLIGSFGSMFGRPNQGAYPPQQQRPVVNPMFAYAGIALALLIALALVYKIIK
ncbi:MAG: hypothetical protein GXO88_07805 [Chlorobi bacterium]|nr:hypothetical protein [Chlorobiota bacterium]